MSNVGSKKIVASRLSGFDLLSLKSTITLYSALIAMDVSIVVIDAPVSKTMSQKENRLRLLFQIAGFMQTDEAKKSTFSSITGKAPLTNNLCLGL
jgi:hypothetical protein